MWHVNSSSGVATSVSELYVLLYLHVTDTACLKLIFAKFARSVKKVPIRCLLHGDVFGRFIQFHVACDGVGHASVVW